MFFGKERKAIRDLRESIEVREVNSPEIAPLEKQLETMRSGLRKKILIVCAGILPGILLGGGGLDYLFMRDGKEASENKPTADYVAKSPPAEPEDEKVALRNSLDTRQKMFASRYLVDLELVRDFNKSTVLSSRDQTLRKLVSSWPDMLGQEEVMSFFRNEAVPKSEFFPANAKAALQGKEFLVTGLQMEDKPDKNFQWFKAHDVPVYEPQEKCLYLGSNPDSHVLLFLMAVNDTQFDVAGKKSEVILWEKKDAKTNISFREHFSGMAKELEETEKDGAFQTADVLKFLASHAHDVHTKGGDEKYRDMMPEGQAFLQESTIYFLVKMLLAGDFVQNPALLNILKEMEAAPGDYLNLPVDPKRVDKDLIFVEIKSSTLKFLGMMDPEWIELDARNSEFIREAVVPFVQMLRNEKLTEMSEYFDKGAIVALGYPLKPKLEDHQFLVGDLDDKNNKFVKSWRRDKGIPYFDSVHRTLYIRKTSDPDELNFQAYFALKSVMEQDLPTPGTGGQDSRLEAKVFQFLSPIMGDVPSLLRSIEGKTLSAVQNRVIEYLAKKWGKKLSVGDLDTKLAVNALVFKIAVFLSYQPNLSSDLRKLLESNIK